MPKRIEAVLTLKRYNTFQTIEHYSDQHLLSSERKKYIEEFLAWEIRFKTDSVEGCNKLLFECQNGVADLKRDEIMKAKEAFDRRKESLTDMIADETGDEDGKKAAQKILDDMGEFDESSVVVCDCTLYSVYLKQKGYKLIGHDAKTELWALDLES